MDRTYVVTGAASGIGAATAKWLAERGGRVITSDLHDADVIADLATPAGRQALADGAAKLSGGRVDGVVANAGGGPPETSLSLNFYGAVATLEGLRPVLAKSPSPRAIAVSSIASLRPWAADITEACLTLPEAEANATARRKWESGQASGGVGANALPDGVQFGLDLYGAAKQALQRWCRKAAPSTAWGGAGIALNVVALGFYDTPAAAYVLTNPEARDAMEKLASLKGSFPGRAEEAAALLAWLVSPENSQMTGQILFADGGFECQATQGGAA